MRFDELKESFKEINRVCKKNSFITLGAYDTNKGTEILDKWAVVASAYMSTNSWLKFFKHVWH